MAPKVNETGIDGNRCCQSPAPGQPPRTWPPTARPISIHHHRADKGHPAPGPRFLPRWSDDRHANGWVSLHEDAVQPGPPTRPAPGHYRNRRTGQEQGSDFAAAVWAVSAIGEVVSAGHRHQAILEDQIDQPSTGTSLFCLVARRAQGHGRACNNKSHSAVGGIIGPGLQWPDF